MRLNMTTSRSWTFLGVVVALGALLLLNQATGTSWAAADDDNDWMEHLDEMAEEYLATTAPSDDPFSTITRTLVEGRSFFFDLFSAQTSDACKYRCKRGIPAMNPKNKPKMDGCGSYSFHLDFDKLPGFSMPGFTECCNHHDICYETCNYDRTVCDDEFLDCLRGKCKENKTKNEKEKSKRQKPDNTLKLPDLPVPDICVETAEFMHKLVTKLGCPAYLSAQKKACVCSTTTTN